MKAKLLGFRAVSYVCRRNPTDCANVTGGRKHDQSGSVSAGMQLVGADPSGDQHARPSMPEQLERHELTAATTEHGRVRIVVSAIVMVGVSMATPAPDAAQIVCLTFGTQTDADRATTKESRSTVDLVASVFVMACIIFAYIYFTG